MHYAELSGRHLINIHQYRMPRYPYNLDSIIMFMEGNDYVDGLECLAQADQALYIAKQKGGDHYELSMD